MSTPKDILVAARERISRPNGWSQGTYTRDADGQACPFEKAASCCLVGSLLCVTSGRRDVDSRDAARAESLLYTHLGGSIVDWNDTPGRTQGEVVDLLDSVIANYDALMEKLEPKK